ncbi:MAG: hypothetical protein MJ105_09870 [Lachnospiraceae bacterium]|nr:hypothetical protein [Lachnospiraceae bacterium]
MRKSKFIMGLPVIALIAGMTACGSGETIANNEEGTNQTEVSVVTPTETPEVEAMTGEGETIETPDTTEDVEPEETVTLSVVNNNGHFVQVGDIVYFHVADVESLGKTALWAQFADQQSGRTVLFAYDLATGEAKEAAFDFTSGGISVQGDVLYSMAYIDNLEEPDEPDVALGSFTQKDGFKTIDLSGDNDKLLGAGLNDSFLAVLHYDYVDNNAIYQIHIYVDGALQNTVDVEDYGDCVALGENTIFYFSGEPETGYNLKQMDVTTGEIIDLGKLPSFDYSEWGGHIDEAIFDGNQVYFTYSIYEGTGHYFSQGFFVQAKAGEAGSIRYEDMPACEVDGEPRAAKFTVKNGQMMVSEGEPGTCEVKGDGVLGYYDEKGEWVAIAEGWESVFFDEDSNYKGVELAEKVGDYIFLIYSENEHVPEEDIGWRYAYCRNYTNVYCISIKTGESTRLVHQAAPWSD